MVFGELYSISFPFGFSSLYLGTLQPKAMLFIQISQRVFEVIRRENALERFHSPLVGVPAQDVKACDNREMESHVVACLDKAEVDSALEEDKSKEEPFELYKRRTTVVVNRKFFLDTVCEALSEYKYVGPNQRADLVIACRYSCISNPN